MALGYIGEAPLDGTLERNRFSPFLMTFVGLVGAFVLFQIIIAPVVLLGMLLAQGVPIASIPAALTTGMVEYSRTFMVANTIGQVGGLALPAWLLARGSSSNPPGFLRLTPVSGIAVVLALIGWMGLLPVVQWLGTVNEMLPLPQSLRDLEASQMKIIEEILRTERNVLFNFAVLALTPAVCEELLFRGYIQRQSERAFGIIGGVAFSGIMFGLYHLRLTQVLPLVLLGLYLAWLTARTGSILPSMVVHLANNGLAVIVAALGNSYPSVKDMEKLPVPVPLLVAGIIILALSYVAMKRYLPSGTPHDTILTTKEPEL